jgi:AAA+ ATPase superfamily predicted ATPase
MKNRQMVYGRDAEIAYLRNNLVNSSSEVLLILYGQRRSGKTTILFQLTNTDILGEHIPVFVDIQGQTYKFSVSKLLRNIATSIAQSMQKKNISISSPNPKDFDADPTDAFNLFLDQVETLLGERKLILLIDEFEALEAQVANGHLDQEFFEYLRSVMQSRRNLCFLLAGTQRIEQLTSSYWSVFFNIANHYRLVKLSEKASRDLIVKPVAGFLEYEPYSIQKIQQLTADQPYLIHLICRALVQHCNEQRKSHVTIKDVNSVLREVMQTGEYHFSWILKQISSKDRIALSALAEGDSDAKHTLSLYDIKEIYKQYHIPYSREELLKSLKRLSDIEIVVSERDDDQTDRAERARYSIPVGLIRMWLRKEKPLEAVLREEAIGSAKVEFLPPA